MRLPYLYHRESPLFHDLKPAFADQAVLNARLEEKRLLQETPLSPLPPGSTLCLFTYMIGGWGDWIAHKEVRKILRARFPELTLRSVVCAPDHFSELKGDEDPEAIVILSGQACPLSAFSENALETLVSADLILSIPTFYPHIDTLTRSLEARKNASIRWLCIGQYGFLESDWFHPQSRNYAMGLHPLEMGILVRKTPPDPEWRSIENTSLLFSLFGTTTPDDAQIADYHTTHAFYLAYLISPVGGAIYLHALLHARKEDNRTIDICSPHLGWLIEYIRQQKEAGAAFVAGDVEVQRIEIHFADRVDTLTCNATGKIVRILCPGTLSDADFRQLIRLSGDFVAVRGDQSFSEAVCANRIFFYDTPAWARYFIKDLVWLAEEYLREYPSALALFRCMAQAALYQLPDTLSPWVEETFFEEKQPWIRLAKDCAEALQQPDIKEGYRHFNTRLHTNHACNEILCALVRRAWPL